MMQFSMPDPPSQPPTLLVLEESPFWFAELQRYSGSEAISLRLRCRVEDAWELLKTGQIKMLIIGPDVDLPAVLRLLTRLTDAVPAPRVTVLLTPEKRDLEWSLRELGAVDVLTTPFSSRELTDIVRREFDLPPSQSGLRVTLESKPSPSNH